MDQAAIINGVADHLADDQRVNALFLSGSFGRGEEDEFSDVDFVAVAAPDHHDDLMHA